jgi:hypothetical protein
MDDQESEKSDSTVHNTALRLKATWRGVITGCLSIRSLFSFFFNPRRAFDVRRVETRLQVRIPLPINSHAPPYDPAGSWKVV